MAATPNPQSSLKMVSRSEYNLLEEWAPQTLDDYSCIKNDGRSAQEHQRDVQTLPKKLQGNPSPRQTRQRSSSVYEEWKAQVFCSRVNNAAPTEPRAALSDVNPSDVNHPASQAAHDTHIEREKVKDHPRVVVGKVITNDQKPPPKSAGHSGRNPKPSTRNSEPHNPKKTNKQPPKSTDSHKPNAGHKHPIGPKFVTPNGTRIGDADLERLAIGVKTQNGDKACFLLSFIADPWSGMKPIETMCFPRNDSTPPLEQGALAIFIDNL
ncbi:hypothetical protein P168DRAFT_314638 [Aspergillus campestris IBT 28561]|uniref:Uncharacterized protein n=1 Tax=Aspergillus campestris (strain IBT 28561) TaxID=1392248 RepID=A0A2I1DFA4_ASPC2|nr:uncharacterized protein P168DRAFT_314638 [Aspergillus campestris IBT 28561]PKY08557.1 hypothetical protein P168DRAFT_314638 [Aspergillus campestris IBT 28561]